MFQTETNLLINKLTNNQYEIHKTQYDIRNTQYEIMQNKANFKIDQIDISTCNRKGYAIFRSFRRPKNKAKQSQFKPNFELKLGLFFDNDIIDR